MHRSLKPEKLDEKYSALLFILFVGSGFAALVYEIVWFHLLRFTIGSSAISLAILLVSFMGGMSLGSGLFHRFVSVRYHPLKVYAVLELAIGACGILVLIVLPLVTKFYVSLAGYGTSGILLRASICLLVLSPPTMLMGATLPAIARWMESNREGASRLGLFYGGNIIGAVLGTVIAGFYLLREFDVFVASAVAVSTNLVVATIGLRLAIDSVYRAAESRHEAIPERLGSLLLIYFVIALSGFTALGAQVIWTRLLSVLLGTTVYTFSVILAVFLAGLGIGSVSGAMIGKRCRSPAIALLICQAALVPAIAFASYAIVQENTLINVALTEVSWALNRANDVLRCAVAILPATVLWGASFPLGIAAIGIEKHDPAISVGRLYALNTAGAIAAVIIISAVVIPLAGTQLAQQLLIATAAMSCGLLFVFSTTKKSGESRSPSADRHNARPGAIFTSILILMLLSYSAIRFVPTLNPALISYGREVGRWHEAHDYLYAKEGMTASVAVTRQRETGYRSFHIGGKVVASTFPEDMRLQRMLGHLPALLHPAPKSALIIGFGAGITAGSFALYESIERIVIVEIEPEVVVAADKYFRKENHDIRNDPRTEIIYDDARHYLSTVDQKFDIITADPVNPWVRGAAALYTQEFFELCKARLTQGGLITQWVPLYETNEAAVKSEVGTFFDVFPEGSIWNSQADAKGYDLVMLAGTGPVIINEQDIRDQLARNGRLRESLAAVNVQSAQDILKSYAGHREHLADWLRGYQPNRDRNLRLEYLAGLSPDLRFEKDIFASLTAAVSYPENFFVLGDQEEAALREWIDNVYGKR